MGTPASDGDLGRPSAEGSDPAGRGGHGDTHDVAQSTDLTELDDRPRTSALGQLKALGALAPPGRHPALLLTHRHEQCAGHDPALAGVAHGGVLVDHDRRRVGPGVVRRGSCGYGRVLHPRGLVLADVGAPRQHSAEGEHTEQHRGDAGDGQTVVGRDPSQELPAANEQERDR